ncbi:AAA family ATPase [Cronobacter sakazakii]|uniref:TrlF family AAA-like ATPase n=1 Tax=Cronobacter sakazakii TaxID=28141 RepID=UPI002895DE1E|nr:AAA family ATPase [Cronobacter sakazakii]MDT3553113.1 AAA family ATPase [Cronobacter sakazakii]
MQHTVSKWWKFDFHTHTPVSMDYGKADHELKFTMTPRQWLMDYIEKGIECIAVTDHNSGGWVDKLKEEAQNLRNEGHSIFIFPGVEITSHGNIHILGIFDPEKTSSSIAQLIGEVKYNGKEGDSDAVTECSPQEVIEIILKRDGVAIPAHIDKPSGLCRVHKSGSTLKQIISNASAVEIIKSHDEYEATEIGSSPLRGYIDLSTGLPEILGSDSHHPDRVGTGFTWVKMGCPSIEGLKLALLDGQDSIKRSDQHEGSPNIYADNIITSIKINGTKYCGRSELFSIDFHPWLNCIIGGRGSGKSTILEFLRTGLCREDELKQLTTNPDILNSYSRLAKKPKSKDDDGVFLDNTTIHIGYRKEHVDYSLQWDFASKKTTIYRVDGENLTKEEGDIISRFPIKIFSQKQIYEISRSPNYLLQLIDESEEVNISNWEYLWLQEKNKLMQYRREVRDLRLNVSLKGTIQGQLTDINNKINSIEKSEHKLVLSNYQNSVTHENAANNLINKLKENIKEFESKASCIKPCHFDISKISENKDNEIEFNFKSNELESALNRTAINIESLIDEYKDKITKFEEWFNLSSLKNEIEFNKSEYGKLVLTFKESGINNPNEYDSLINTRKNIIDRLTKITADEEKIKEINNLITESYNELVRLRKELTTNRRKFLSKINLSDEYIKVNVDFCGDNQFIESGFRNILGRTDSTFSNEIYNDEEKGFLNVLNKKITENKENDHEIIKIIQEFIKSFLDKSSEKILDVSIGKRFIDFRSNLPEEIMDSLICWFPNDSINVKYYDGRRYKDISQGSAGQKAATVLAFLLSYGNDPLVLDQPEDDLDNQLIYDLIVKKIKESKKNRQILIVTHNANIVVNGDSELVIALTQQTGMTKFSSFGGLHDRLVRAAICEIMEGGRDAFHQRYKRIIYA